MAPSRDTPHARFDDRVHTAFLIAAGDLPARVAAWRQMIDLLCQPGLPQETSDAFVDAVAERASEMDEDARLEAARVAAFGTPPPGLVVLLGNDRPAVAAALLRDVTLSESDWSVVLPELGPVARGILRSRRDLDPATRARLASFGPADFALPGRVDPAPVPAAAPATAAEAGLTRISDLVARIEAYRQGRRPDVPGPAEADDFRDAEPLAGFAFETDAAAIIRWVDVSESAALVGIALDGLATGSGPGVDGVAFGAVRRRCGFSAARLIVASGGPAGGAWRVSATPGFDAETGRFMGYRGVARRPQASEQAEPIRPRSGLSHDLARQLVHELRTPINAIGGFAELIERQIVGPVSAPYRTAAAAVRDQAMLLAAGVDDIDTAARLDGRALAMSAQVFDLAVLARAAAAELAGEGHEVQVSGGSAPVTVDPVAADRMVRRLFALAMPERDGAVVVDVVDGHARMVIPWQPRDEDGVADPLLGADFTLRLVAALASEGGGTLRVDEGRLTLSLPAAATAGETVGSS